MLRSSCPIELQSVSRSQGFRNCFNKPTDRNQSGCFIGIMVLERKVKPFELLDAGRSGDPSFGN
jgi:hypothetical protein